MRKHPPYSRAIGGRVDPDRSELPVALDDAVVPNPGALERSRDRVELGLVSRAERHGDATWLGSRVGGLAGSVNRLSDLLSDGHVPANDDVVAELVLATIVNA